MWWMWPNWKVISRQTGGHGMLDEEQKLTFVRSVRPLPQVDHDSQQDKGWFYDLQQRGRMRRSRLLDSWQKKKRSNSEWIASGVRLRSHLEDREVGVGRFSVWVGWRQGRSWFLIEHPVLWPKKICNQSNWQFESTSYSPPSTWPCCMSRVSDFQFQIILVKLRWYFRLQGYSVAIQIDFDFKGCRSVVVLRYALFRSVASFRHELQSL